MDEREVYDLVWNATGVRAKVGEIDIKDVIVAYKLRLVAAEAEYERMLKYLPKLALLFEGTQIIAEERANTDPQILERVREGLYQSIQRVSDDLHTEKHMMEFYRNSIKELKRIKEVRENE